MKNPTNFATTRFKVSKLFENTPPPLGFENLTLSNFWFILRYKFPSNLGYIDQILRSSIRYAELSEISNFFILFIHSRSSYCLPLHRVDLQVAKCPVIKTQQLSKVDGYIFSKCYACMSAKRHKSNETL